MIAGTSQQHTVDVLQSFLLIDVKTLDAAGLTHVITRHTDRVRLAAHRYVTKCAVEEEYGALPAENGKDSSIDR